MATLSNQEEEDRMTSWTSAPHIPNSSNDEGDEEKSATAAVPMTKFLDTRTVLIFGQIDQKLAQNVSAQLLYLDHVSHEPIKIIVNSPGGHVESGDTIHDFIQYISSPVAVIGTGWVASAGTHIFLGAEKSRRFCLPNTRFLIHQPAGGTQGKATDIEIAANEIIRMRERLAKVIADRTGQPLERVAQDIERDYWMTTSEAIDYGILGKVIKTAAEVTF
jgi:ATP-dependent Clp protease, protease subunit